MMLATGARLGPYEIIGALGAGGMGEVYRARDTRLERTVAIKVLPADLAADADRRARFEREARAISSLNHPHICTLHDVGHQDGIDYLVMEYMEGETLADRLERGPLPLDDVLRYGGEMAGALGRAHRAGIVHRDLKPGNVMLTRAGVKLLDFGLAKLRVDGGAGTLSALATAEKPLTGEGTLLGTLPYMSPEQVEGGEADARSDIWALGTVLYEMATGKRAFEGKSQASLIGAILKDEPPPITNLQPLAPPVFEHLVRTCLEKDPDERWQSAHDVATELKWMSVPSEAGESATAASVRRARRERLAWATTAALALALAATGIALARLAWRPPVESPPTRFAVSAPENARFGASFALSPNGRQLAFVAESAGRTSLWVRPLDSLDARRLDGTEGAMFPFWSPDSRHIGFFADKSLKRIEASGGAPRALGQIGVEGRGGTWSRQGVIVYAPDVDGPLYRIPEAGGEAAPATRLPTTEPGTIRLAE